MSDNVILPSPLYAGFDTRMLNIISVGRPVALLRMRSNMKHLPPMPLPTATVACGMTYRCPNAANASGLWTAASI